MSETKPEGTEEGAEEKVFTQADIDAAKDEAVKAATQAATEAVTETQKTAIKEFEEKQNAAQEEIADLRAQLEKNKDDIDDNDGSSGNAEAQKNRLIQKNKELQERLDKEIAALKEDVTSFKQETIGNVEGDLKKQYMDGLDEEKRKLVEFEFERYRPTETSREAIEERLQAAVRIALPEDGPSMLDGIMSRTTTRGEGEVISSTPKEAKISDSAKAAAKKLGVTDDELKAQEKRKAARLNK